MTFVESVQSANDAYQLCTDVLNRCDAFAEACYNEYNINLKEAQLKVIEESGTKEDLIMLEDAASEGFIVKAKKTIEKIAKTVKDFIKKIISSISDFFKSKKVDETLETAEKVVKNNPKLKNKKVSVPDVDKQLSLIGKFESKNDRRLTMMKANKFNEKAEDIEKDSNEYDKMKKAAVGATMMVSISVAIALIKKLKNKSSNIDDTIVIGVNDNITPENTRKLLECKQFEGKLKKDYASAIYKSITKTIATVKSSITGKKGSEMKILDDDVFDESMMESNIGGIVATESDIDPEEYISNLLDEIQESVESDDIPDEDQEVTEQNVEESVITVIGDDGEPTQVTPSAFLESLEDLILLEDFDESETLTSEQYLEAMEAELFGDDDDSLVEESTSVDKIMEDLESMLK